MTKSRVAQFLLRSAAVLAGVIPALVIWGRATPQEVKLRHQAENFNQLPPAAQERIRPAWQDYQNQPEERRKAITEIHRAVTADNELADRMFRFTNWWASLDPFVREDLKALPRQELLQEVTSRYQADQSARKLLKVEFDVWWLTRFGPGPRGGERERPGGGGPPEEDHFVPPLSLTSRDFGTLMDQIAASDSFAEFKPGASDIASLGNENDRLLLKCLTIMDAFLSAEGSEGRRSLLEDIHSRLLTDVPDAAWRDQYRARTEDPRFGRLHRSLTPLVLVRSLVEQLGQRLQGSVALDDETIIREFAATSDQSERRELMQLPPELARQRIEQRVFATGQGGDTPERRLMKQYLEIQSRTSRFFRSSEWRALLPGGGGPGGPGGGPPRPPNGSPGRDNPRPQR